MKNYQSALRDIMAHGVDKGDRTGTGQREVFGMELRFNLADGFPLVTTKKTWFKGVVHELLWLISGDTNIQYLLDNDVHIWDEWADDNGDLGPVYGKQWRRYEVLKRATYVYDPYHPALYTEWVDQLQNSIDRIKTHPDCRRNIVECWNVSDLPAMALTPCHKSFQWCVQEGRLHLKMEQRSADFFLGVPFNIASYALLNMMVAKLTDLEPGNLIMSFGSAHIYHNHFEQVQTCLDRQPRSLPEVVIHGDQKTIDDFEYDDFELIGYNPRPSIKADVAI